MLIGGQRHFSHDDIIELTRVWSIDNSLVGKHAGYAFLNFFPTRKGECGTGNSSHIMLRMVMSATSLTLALTMSMKMPKEHCQVRRVPKMSSFRIRPYLAGLSIAGSIAGSLFLTCSEHEFAAPPECSKLSREIIRVPLHR